MLTLPDERGPGMDTHNNAFNGDEIRQIQTLLALFTCLPPNGKLHELFSYALGLSEDSQLAHVTPIKDASFDGVKTWLEALWLQGGLTPNEQKVVDWQKSGHNMEAAVRELKAVEQKIGLKLSASVGS
ncbi:MAG TPA: DurN family substrate-assisted peptide maturase [Ktedonobacteraceae bacterium]|nr:DurN family substrate-assisted peptide maturase [Ktedonobacteraceae bacterium]